GQDHHLAERKPRSRIRSIRESVPGMRARLHLLLRPSESCPSRALARSRFRDQALLQAGGGGAAARRAIEARLPAGARAAGREYGLLPAHREETPVHTRDYRGIV